MLPLVVLLVNALGYILARTSYFGMSDPSSLVQALLPPHGHGPQTTADPFGLIEGMLQAVMVQRSRLTWLAVPAFLWFASRLFAAIRTSLSQIFKAKQPRRHPRLVLDFMLGFAAGKLRDFGMMGVLLSMALMNTVLTTTVALLVGRGNAAGAPLGFLGSGAGRILAELVALGSAFLLFALLYRYSSPRRIPWRAAAIAAGIATVGFDLARRLFGLYLGYWAARGIQSIDANIGAAILFLLWLYWVGIVFLLGAAAAEVWRRGRTAQS